jgi:cytidylate kinase
MAKRNIVTIDGPSGSGKSTVAKLLSAKLNWSYLDSGAIYRVVALYAINNGITTISDIISDIGKIRLKFIFNDGAYSVFLNENDVTSDIRREEVGEYASVIAQDENIRAALISVQKNYNNGNNIVTDGRDMGTKIFPDAKLKFFLTASVDERAARRFFELQQKGAKVDLDIIKSQITIRDERDKKRSSSPLRAADDCIHIDTTSLSINEVVDKLYNICDNNALSER